MDAKAESSSRCCNGSRRKTRDDAVTRKLPPFTLVAETGQDSQDLLSSTDLNVIQRIAEFRNHVSGSGNSCSCRPIPLDGRVLRQTIGQIRFQLLRF